MSVERRTYPRVVVNWKVSVETGGAVLSGHAGDISLGGMTVFSADPLEIGALCRLQFAVPNNHSSMTPVEVMGRVVYVVLAANVCEFRHGLVFVKPSEAAMKTLGQYLHFRELAEKLPELGGKG